MKAKTSTPTMGSPLLALAEELADAVVDTQKATKKPSAAATAAAGDQSITDLSIRKVPALKR